MSLMASPKVPGSPGHKRVIHPDDTGFWKQVNDLSLHLANVHHIAGFKGVEPKARPNGNSTWVFYDTGYLYITFRFRAPMGRGGQWAKEPFRYDTVLDWMCEGMASFAAGKDKGERARIVNALKADCGLTAPPPAEQSNNEPPGTVVASKTINSRLKIQTITEEHGVTLALTEGDDDNMMALGQFPDRSVAQRAADELREWFVKHGGEG